MGSWPYLVKRGGLEVLPRVPVHERARNTTLFLRSNLSMFLVEVLMLPTSPNVAKSRVYLAKSCQRLTSWVSHQTIRPAPLFQADELFRSIRVGSSCPFLLLERL